MWVVKPVDKVYQLWYSNKHVANYSSSVDANRDCDKLNKSKTTQTLVNRRTK